MFYQLKFRNKLSLTFLLITVFSLALSLVSSVTLYNSRINDELTPRLEESVKAVNASFNNIKDKSLIYADLFNDNPPIISLIENGSPKSEIIKELLKFGGKTDLDILQITDGNGVVLGRMENVNLYDDNKRADPLIVEALKGGKISALHEVDKKLAIVAVLPIKTAGKIIGTVTAGYKVNNQLLQLLKNFTGEELLIYYRNVLTASTIPDLKINTPIDNDVINILGKLSTQNSPVVGRMNFQGKRYLSGVTTLTGFRDKEIGYLVSVASLEPVIAANNNTLYSLFIIFIFTAVLALSISIYLSEQIVKPINLIQKGAEIIGSGDLSYKLNIKTGDEIEKVAQSFNTMAEKLNDSFKTTQAKMQQLEGQRNRLDLTAKLLLRRDLEIREVNEELEKEKWSISAEKNKLALILSGIADAVIALDLERKVIIFSQGAETLTGITAKEALGKHIDKIIKIFRPLDQQVSVNEFCPIKIPETMDTIIFQEQHLGVNVPSNKKEFYANIMSATIKESKIISLGCILTLHDVTAEHDLEQMKVDFVSMAAHELRTPLTSITGYLYFLQEELTPTLTPEQKTYLERVVISSKQLQTLIDNLLDVSKIEKGSLTLELKKESWEDLLTEMVKNFKDYAAQKEIQLELNLPEHKLPHVLVDKFRISEVLTNLLSNAVNFTSHGGKVSIKASYKKGEVVTEIKDTGTGIPKEALPKLFTKFYRVSGILSEGSKGTGLGLFISKAIVELHKGKIWAKSEFGKGSTFSFSLQI